METEVLEVLEYLNKLKKAIALYEEMLYNRVTRAEVLRYCDELNIHIYTLENLYNELKNNA